MRPALTLRVLAPGVLIGLVACGGGGGAAETDDSVTAGEYTEADYVAGAAEALDLPDAQQAQCIAQSIISGIGFEQIEATGLSPQNFGEAESLADTGVTLDDAQTTAMREGIAGCGDLVATFISSDDVSEEEAICAQDLLDNELIAEVLVVELADIEPSPELLAARTSLEECAAG